MKRKIFYAIKKYCTINNIQTLVLALLAVYIIIDKAENPLNLFKSLGKSELVVSLLLIAACTLLFKLLSYVVALFTEDAAKVNPNPREIIKQYPICDMIVEDGQKFPINALWVKNDPEDVVDYVINDEPNSFYKLPTQVDKHYDEIMGSAHKVSKTYNQINIRMNSFEYNQSAKRISFGTERTTYYDLLVTNRAMDIIWNNGLSVRSLYEPGPYLNSLANSRLANHIGYNGMVETSDGMLVNVYRGPHVSTDKNQYKFSISGSLKTRYVLNEKEKQIYSIGQICNAVTHEIIDELNIDTGLFKDYKERILFEKDDIIAFYRDVCEGGKPHFLFYKKLNLTKNEIDLGLNKITSKSSKSSNVDGTRFKWISHEDFVEARVDEPRADGKTDVHVGNESLIMNFNNAGLFLMIRDYVRKL